MSIKVMTAVFERYPNGGGEMLLALALADHASDDGSRIFPSIKALAEKTRQSERSVQYQMRRMQEMGWLILVSAGNGGRSMTSEYRISSEWLKGAEIAPFKKGAIDDQKGANDDIKGCNSQQKRVQRVAPANNRHRTVIEPSVIVIDGADAPTPTPTPAEPAKTPKAVKTTKPASLVKPEGVDDQVWADFLQIRKAKRSPLTATALAGIEREAAKAGIGLQQALEVCCESGWAGFKADWFANQRTANAPAQGRGQIGRKQAQSFAEKDYGTGIQVL